MAMWPTCGQSGYITHAVLGVPKCQRRDNNQKWLCGPHAGNVATTPLPSRGAPTLSAGTTIRNRYVAHMWVKWLHHPCRLGGPQRSARGQQSQMAMWPTCGKSGYITPAGLGVPNAQRGDNNQKWLGGPHAGKVATSSLPSWGSPTLNAGTTITNGYVVHMREKWLHHRCCLGGPQRSARRQKLEMAMWSTCGQSGYITAAVLGVPITHHGAINHKWLCGPHAGNVATSSLPSWRSPTLSAGTTITNGSVVHMREKWLHHPCRLGGPQRSARRQKLEMAMWSTCGQSGYITPAVLEGGARSTQEQQSQMAMWSTCGKSGYIIATVLEVPNAQRGDNNHKWLCGPHAGKVATSPLPSWGPPTLSAKTKIRNGYVVHTWAKWLHHRCRLGGPQRSTRGQQSQMAMWSTCGKNGYITAAVLGVPNAQSVDKNQKWLCGTHVGKVATSPLPS